ncbi:retropepsin-like aspartic protease [uncultured Psychroserpens sp.]|uniref:retropepsin-like aspartic protease n=1 Tax=uncultured Psychroserpens sp. TaxID=255436 RepID=UPI0026239321|nr:retropepsin-like aspartic protease [uncultured Psychroserpens sp.]
MKIRIQIVCKLLVLAFSLTACAQNASLKNGYAKSKNYYEEIPFEFDKNKIIIPVEIEGKTYRFLLDTGAPNIISAEVLQAVKPKIIATIPTNDANRKKQNLDVVSLKSLKLGAVEFENATALVYDLNRSDIFKCFGIDGFIGSNLLRQSILQIDAKNRVLKLTDRPRRLQLDKKLSEKIKLVGNQSSPYVWIKLKGKESGKELVLIDTGMGSLYDVSRENFDIFKSKTIFNAIGQSDGASSISLFGEVPVNNQIRVHLPTLVINDFEIKNYITHTTKDDNSKIGAELLNYGVMTIDFKNKRFYFNPYSETLDVSKPMLGFTRTFKNSKIVIGYVWDEDLKTKLKYGDEVLAINDEVLTESKICEYVTKSSTSESLNQIKLKIKNKEGNIVDVLITKKELDKILNDFNIRLN